MSTRLDTIAPQIYNGLPMDFGTLEEEAEIVHTVVTALHKKLAKVGVEDALFCSSLGIQSMNVIRIGLASLMALGGSKYEARELTRLIVSRLDNDYVNLRCTPSLSKNLKAVFETIKGLVPDILLPPELKPHYTEGTCHSYLVNQGDLETRELCDALNKYSLKRPAASRLAALMPDYHKTVHFSCPNPDGNFEQCIRVENPPTAPSIDCTLIDLHKFQHESVLRGIHINATVTGVRQPLNNQVCEELQERYFPDIPDPHKEMINNIIEGSLEIVLRKDE